MSLATSEGLPEWLARPVIIQSTPADSLIPTSSIGLSPSLFSSLAEQGISSLFPVQHAVIQRLRDASHLGDLCVSAPTGSGKTLAYAIPIIENLHARIVKRLRALIIVPTRELVLQVQAVFLELSKGTPIKIGIAIGQSSLGTEQHQLVGKVDGSTPILRGGKSLVDILIATPGRLVEHLRSTPNFTLQHLRFLVIDEADRLLEQSFQDWLGHVLSALDLSSSKYASISPTNNIDAVTWRRKEDAGFATEYWTTPVRKLLFSATLTRNPAKIASLQLTNPTYLLCTSSNNPNPARYSKPAGLEEYMIVCEEEQKPLITHYLLDHYDIKSCLCFTKSLESTERLYELLKLMGRQRIAAFSSRATATRRVEILSDFCNGRLDLLVCSDAMARGLDLDNVDAVLNYDVPVHLKSYIHRVGRTARAGKSGRAFSVVARKEAHHFKEMTKDKPDEGWGKNNKIQQVRPKAKLLSVLRPKFEESLQLLKLKYTKPNRPQEA